MAAENTKPEREEKQELNVEEAGEGPPNDAVRYSSHQSGLWDFDRETDKF